MQSCSPLHVDHMTLIIKVGVSCVDHMAFIIKVGASYVDHMAFIIKVGASYCSVGTGTLD